MSIKVDGKLVENFSISEMANNKAIEDIKLVLTPAVTLHCLMMQELRKWYNKPMTVNLRYRDWETDRKSTRLNSSHSAKSRMPSSA